MNEEWRDVVGFECYYEVSNIGNVRRKKGTSRLQCKQLKGIPDKDGYFRVNLKVKCKTHTKRIHRLVAMAFIDNVEQKEQINHINGIKNDNRVENLEWCSNSENRIHAYLTGLQNGLSRRGVKNNFNKLTNEEIIKIKSLYDKKNGMTMKRIAEKFNVTEGCIQRIISKKNWAWL